MIDRQTDRWMLFTNSLSDQFLSWGFFLQQESSSTLPTVDKATASLNKANQNQSTPQEGSSKVGAWICFLLSPKHYSVVVPMSKVCGLCTLHISGRQAGPMQAGRRSHTQGSEDPSLSILI